MVRARHFVSVVSIVAGLCAALAPGQARAFRCTQALSDATVSDPPSLSWNTRQLSYVLQPSGSKFLDPNATFTVLRKAFDVWQRALLSDAAQAQCGNGQAGTSDIEFMELKGSRDETWVGYNFLAPKANANLLVFRDDMWPPHDDPTATDTIALSTITYSALTGEIIDADIEFNSANFSFSAEDPTSNEIDLMGTAVHEIGHFLGLAHCADSGGCGHGEVMEPTANQGEMDKRLLQCDDLNGLVFKYPAGKVNGYSNKLASLTDTAQGLGTCLPPQTASQRPTVRQLHRSEGRMGCQQGPVDGTLWPLGLAWAVRRGARGRAGGRRTWRSRQGPWKGPHAAKQTRAAWAVLMGLLTGGCTASHTCDGSPLVIDPNGPLIVGMRFLGQVDIDPWHVVLECSVIDADGDLGGGTVDYFVNGAKTSAQTQSLDRVFNASGGVPLDTRAASTQLLVRFPRDTASDARLKLGTQVTDAAGHKSNCYMMDLSYLLSDVVAVD